MNQCLSNFFRGLLIIILLLIFFMQWRSKRVLSLDYLFKISESNSLSSYLSTFPNGTIFYSACKYLNTCCVADCKIDTEETIPLVEIKTFNEKDLQFESVSLGGHWCPKCPSPYGSVAVIVSYRKRERNLRTFIPYMHKFLQKQNLDYTIFVVRQDEHTTFNRGLLLNIGYVEAKKIHDFACYIFHDVDLIPENLSNLYKCDENPKHMSVAIDKFNYKLPYNDIFGGVTAMKPRDFEICNGYSNLFWGWGGEDDDLSFRVRKILNKSIVRPDMKIARYKMLFHNATASAPLNPFRSLLLKFSGILAFNGLKNVKEMYKLQSIKFCGLFTFIDVVVFEPNSSYTNRLIEEASKLKQQRNKRT